MQTKPETTNGPLTYNPVIKNGRFEVEGFGNKFTFSASCPADAIYKFMVKFEIKTTIENHRAIWKQIKATTIRPTKRMLDN